MTTDNAKVMKTMPTIRLIESIDCKYRSGSNLTWRIWANERLCKRALLDLKGALLHSLSKNGGHGSFGLQPLCSFLEGTIRNERNF